MKLKELILRGVDFFKAEPVIAIVVIVIVAVLFYFKANSGANKGVKKRFIKINLLPHYTVRRKPSNLEVLGIKIQRWKNRRVKKFRKSQINLLKRRNTEDYESFKQVRSEVPHALFDNVHFSITSSPVMMTGGTYLMDVWAHLESQREEVVERAVEEAASPKIRIKTKGPVNLARGAIATVSLQVPDLSIDPFEDTILWDGEIGNATFAATVHQKAAPGTRLGEANIYVNGLRIARLFFEVAIGIESVQSESLSVRQERYDTAYASYASEDRYKVLGRIQGIKKGLPDLDIFFDQRDLRAGEHWQDRLRHEIECRDVMYLFWSEAASQSKWVDWEWRFALQARGIDFIDPVPLVSPSEVPPPPELASKHFNDWVLGFIQSRIY